MGRCVMKVINGWGLEASLVTAAFGAALCCQVSFVQPAHAQGAASSQRLTLAQVFDLQWASDARISPDGKQIAFVRESFDVMHNAPAGSVWLVNSDGSDLHQLTDASAKTSQPVWSPHGNRLLYVSSAGTGKDKKSELQVRETKTGKTTQLAELKYKPSELVWSPDGTRIAFAMFTPEKQGSIANMPAMPEGAKWGPPVIAEDRLVYRFNGAGYLPHGYIHLFVISASGGAPRQLTSGNQNDSVGEVGGSGGVAWSRDGRSLIFAANRKIDAAYHPGSSEIYEVSLEGGEPHALTHRDGPNHSPAVSPDGTKIAYVGYDDTGKGFSQLSHLYVMDRDGGNPRLVITDLDRSVGDPQWSANGRGLYFQYVDRSITKLAYTTLKGQVTPLAEIPGGGIAMPYSGGQYSLSPATGKFAFLLSAPDHPADIAIGRRSGDKASTTRLTRLNQSLLSQVQLGTLEAIQFPSSYDHRAIGGWILKPPGFDPTHKYPLVLEIHGGPSASYSAVFSAEDQIFAALGYVVLYTNPRGSTSYGQKFADLINLDYPDHDYDDLMSGVDAVIQRGYIDPQRLYVTGGSGGGVLTAWAVGHTDRFRAAVVVKPVINWYSWALTADMGYTGMKYWMEGYPWDNLKHYMERSPISYVGNVKTPTMVMHGTVDYRTPGADAVQFYRALKMLKVPAALVLIPGASHEIAERPRDYAAKIAYITGWFACYGGQSVGSHVCPYAAEKKDGATAHN